MDRRVRPDQSGFTLIELMIAVAVMASLATAVTLSVAWPGPDRQTSDLRVFRTMHDRILADAAISRTLMGVAITDNGYQRLRWTGAWDAVGQETTWRGPVALLQPFRGVSPLEFAPSGQVTRFRVRFGEGDTARFCEGNGWGQITCSGG